MRAPRQPRRHCAGDVAAPMDAAVELAGRFGAVSIGREDAYRAGLPG
jgi:hypothetical protein